MNENKANFFVNLKKISIRKRREPSLGFLAIKKMGFLAYKLDKKLSIIHFKK